MQNSLHSPPLPRDLDEYPPLPPQYCCCWYCSLDIATFISHYKKLPDWVKLAEAANRSSPAHLHYTAVKQTRMRHTVASNFLPAHHSYFKIQPNSLHDLCFFTYINAKFVQQSAAVTNIQISLVGSSLLVSSSPLVMDHIKVNVSK